MTVRRLLALLMMMLVTTPALALPGDGARTLIGVARPQRGWFLCDGLDQPVVALIGARVANGRAAITTLAKRPGARAATTVYEVGKADPGAGQIYWPLSLRGRVAGVLHQFNPGAYDAARVRTPSFTSIRLGERDIACRWSADTRLLGITGRRTLQITQERGGLMLRTFDHGRRAAMLRADGVQQTTPATMTFAGGSEVRAADGTALFRFTGGGTSYAIRVPAAQAAVLTLARGGRVVAIEPLLANTLSSQGDPAAALPPVPRVGAGDTWNGFSRYDCSAATEDSCLIDQMRYGGASGAAVAFTRALVARSSHGFVSGWQQSGSVGIATVTYPFRSVLGQGYWLFPRVGPPLDLDAYRPTSTDKARADYKAAAKLHPEAFPAGDSEVAAGTPLPGGGQRIVWKIYLVNCTVCGPQGSMSVAYDFDAAGRLLRRGVVDVQ